MFKFQNAAAPWLSRRSDALFKSKMKNSNTFIGTRISSLPAQYSLKSNVMVSYANDIYSFLSELERFNNFIGPEIWTDPDLPVPVNHGTFL